MTPYLDCSDRLPFTPTPLKRQEPVPSDLDIAEQARRKPIWTGRWAIQAGRGAGRSTETRNETRRACSLCLPPMDVRWLYWERETKLLDVEQAVKGVTTGKVCEDLKTMGALATVDGKSLVLAQDLEITAGWGIRGQGGITMTRRIAALLAIGPELDENYRQRWKNPPGEDCASTETETWPGINGDARGCF